VKIEKVGAKILPNGGQPIASGNRSPQTFSAHFLRKSLAKNFFSRLLEEIA